MQVFEIQRKSCKIPSNILIYNGIPRDLYMYTPQLPGPPLSCVGTRVSLVQDEQNHCGGNNKNYYGLWLYGGTVCTVHK